jgi:hypothetical protein
MTSTEEIPVKNPEDVIVMKKLTTRGLQALAGGPSKLRSARPAATIEPVPASAPTAPRSPLPPPLPPPTVQASVAPEVELSKPTPQERARALMDSQFDITLPRERSSTPPREFLPEIEALPKKQMVIATPPTLVHAKHDIPDDIRQLAIRSLEMQKTQAQSAPPSAGHYPSSAPAVALPTNRPVPSSIKVKAPVSPVPPAPQPGAPAVLKGESPVQVVVRRETRRTAFGWTAMLLALGVFIGLATVAVAHGDAAQAYTVLKQYASQKRTVTAPAAQPTVESPVAVVAPTPPPVATPQADPQPQPTTTPAPSTPTSASGNAKVADNKPADVKDTPRPKPEPKPEVTKPDPAPRPAPKPANAYAKADRTDRDDKPEPKVAASTPKPVVAKSRPEKDDTVAAAPEPKPRPAPAADDSAAKISQMAQQQLGAALP